MCSMCDADDGYLLFDDAPMSEDLGIFEGMYDEDDYDPPLLTLDEWLAYDMKPEPDPLEVKVRDGFLSKARSEVSYKWERTRRAGSGVSFFKRQARRAERRVARDIIREQLAA